MELSLQRRPQTVDLLGLALVSGPPPSIVLIMPTLAGELTVSFQFQLSIVVSFQNSKR